MRSEEVSSFNRSCFSGSLNELVVEAARKRRDILIQVGLEYRYMPPVAKLISRVTGGSLGRVKMVAIREHRFPFLVKVNNWNGFNINSGWDTGREVLPLL